MQLEYDIVTGSNIRKLSNGTIVNRFTHLVQGCEIGKNCMIGQGCYVARDAVIGDNTRIQNHVSIFDGVEIGQNCFIAPKVCFTNHHNPQDRLKRKESEESIPDKTIVSDNVTICAAAVLVAPIKIAKGSRIGAGSIVLRDVKENEQANGLIKGKK